MLELAILGFLREEDLHGYELKQRITLLSGYYRSVSDGALYPAIARLARDGMLARRQSAGAGAAPRQMLSITPTGEAALRERLRAPADVDISDRNHFFTLLAFLKFLTPTEQKTVLARRLAFVESAHGFFERDGRFMHLNDETDPYRQGMLRIARETARVEKDWLRERIAQLIELTESEP